MPYCNAIIASSGKPCRNYAKVNEPVCFVHETRVKIAQSQNETYYKFIGNNEGSYPYKLGLNTLADNNETFDPRAQCGPGGLYFADSHFIFNFMGYGNTLCLVTIPDGAQIVKINNNKWKTDQIIIESMHEFWTVETWKMLFERGVDFVTRGPYFLISGAIRRQNLELIKFWHENIQPIPANFSCTHANQDIVNFFASL